MIVRRKPSVEGLLERLSRSRPPVAATPIGGAKGFVAHGAEAGIARPSQQSVEWQGSVEPSNAINGDTWLKTNTLQLYVRLSGAWKAVA